MIEKDLIGKEINKEKKQDEIFLGYFVFQINNKKYSNKVRVFRLLDKREWMEREIVKFRKELIIEMYYCIVNI